MAKTYRTGYFGKTLVRLMEAREMSLSKLSAEISFFIF